MRYRDFYAELGKLLYAAADIDGRIVHNTIRVGINSHTRWIDGEQVETELCGITAKADAGCSVQPGAVVEFAIAPRLSDVAARDERRDGCADIDQFRISIRLPDGEFVAFSMVRPGPYADIWIVSVDGSQLLRVTDEPSVDNVVGGWAR